MGIDLGKAIAPPSYDNPKGFYENLRVQELNHKLLTALKITWDYTGFLKEQWWKHPSITKYKAEAIEIIQKEFKGQDLFAIKEPRICYLFPFWEEVLLSLDIAIQCVVMLRHPEEVVASLEKRNQFSYTKSHLLYLSHLFCIEKYRQEYVTAFVRYDELLADPVQTVQRLDKELSLSTPTTKMLPENFDDFITKAFRNHHFSESKLIKKPFLSHIESSYQLFYNLDKAASNPTQIALLRDKHQSFLEHFGNEVDKGKRYTTSVLIDFGQGFQEVEKLSAVIKDYQHNWDIGVWCKDQLVKRIKLIPISNPGFVTIDTSSELKAAEISSNAYLVDNQDYYFEAAQPEIIFQFRTPQTLDNCTVQLSYDYLIPSVDFSLNETEKELTQLKTSFSYRLGWLLTSPFRLVYYLYRLIRTSRISQVGPLLKSVFQNPLGLLKSIQPQHFKTLKNALLTEPPEVIFKNIIKLIRRNN